jgi:hypothetical protein
MRFVTSLACDRGHRRESLQLENRLPRRPRVCRKCRLAMRPTGAARTDRLRGEELTSRQLRRTLRQLGLVRGDVFSVESASAPARRFEITSA